VLRKKSITRFSETAKTTLLIGGAAILALDAARRIFRRMQLFCPTREPLTSWNPEDHGVPPGRTEELWIETDDGETLYGWYCRAENPIASALYFHGNTGNLTNTAFTIPHLLAGGINVLFFDYRGFGRSSGSPSFDGIVDDGVAAAREHEKLRPKDVPSILYGYSLGGSIGAQVIQRFGFDGLILQSTFTSLPDIARVAFPRVPIHLVSGRLLDTQAILKKLHIPLLLIHGGSDEVCPSWMARTLYDSCASKKKELVVIDGGLHKDLWVREPATLVSEISRFVKELPVGAHGIEVPPSPIEYAIDAAFRSLRRFLRRRITPTPTPPAATSGA
jgi:fermentation-respiration switch protein FrsA (DUF1100 family)